MALHNRLNIIIVIIIKRYFHEKVLYNCFVQSGPLQFPDSAFHLHLQLTRLLFTLQWFFLLVQLWIWCTGGT